MDALGSLGRQEVEPSLGEGSLAAEAEDTADGVAETDVETGVVDSVGGAKPLVVSPGSTLRAGGAPTDAGPGSRVAVGAAGVYGGAGSGEEFSDLAGGSSCIRSCSAISMSSRSSDRSFFTPSGR